MTIVLVVALMAFSWTMGVATALLVGYLVDSRNGFTRESEEELVEKIALAIIAEEHKKRDSQTSS